MHVLFLQSFDLIVPNAVIRILKVFLDYFKQQSKYCKEILTDTVMQNTFVSFLQPLSIIRTFNLGHQDRCTPTHTHTHTQS